MEEKFKELLDILCSDIKSKSAYKRVREELLDHLTLKYSDYIDMGYNEEEALTKTISEFGDPEKLKNQLAKEHPYNPMTSAGLAMNLIIIGFLLLSFKINLFTGMEQLTDFAGNLFMLTGIMCFAKNGGKMKTAFRLFLGYIGISAVKYAVDPFISSISFVSFGMGLVINILSLAAWLTMISSFEQLTEPFGNGTKIPYSANKVFRVILQIVAIIGTFAVFASGEENIDINSPVISIVFIAISILAVIFGIIMFVRIKRVLNQNEHDYKIEDNTDKKIKFGGAVLASCIVLTLICNSVYICMPAKSYPHEKDNIEMSDKEYSSIVKKMESYGDVSELIEILPKSEIEKLKNVVPCNKRSYPAMVAVALHGMDSCDMTSYCFELNDNGITQLRIIKIVKPNNEKALPTRMGFKWTIYGDIAYVNKKDFCMVYNTRTKEDSKVFRKSFNICKSLEEVEFYGTQSSVLCIAKTIEPTHPYNLKSEINVAKFKLPVCGMQRNLSAVLSSGNYWHNAFIDSTYTWDDFELNDDDSDEFEEDDDFGDIGGISG